MTQTLRTWGWSLALLGSMLLCGWAGWACSEEAPLDPSTQPAPEISGDAITKTTTVGPVTATVTATPAAPRLGDPVQLTLDVVAEPNVDVQLPAFGDQLGRFDILDYAPTQGVRPGGGTHASQRYTIDPPMSGTQRIPPLLVEFVDNRPGTEGGDELQELLTEEVKIDVVSVIPDGDVNTALRPARGPLPALPDPAEEASSTIWLAVGLGALALLVGLAILLWWLRRGHRRKPDPFALALKALDALAKRGLPEPAAADSWYVELSDIVRRYIERRYALRAPELTTEEFLQDAQASHRLLPAHSQLLRALLERSDRVKFAAYVPQPDESQEALAMARRFLVESRPAPSETPSP